ncbi:hypothetical protein BDK51DRAFT_51978 [Blyttiomyces helicus]|uniref:Uncharacterized protein n=1 Tax=Blyttiomyces helicus TaxID=388810 RepID=A0A4V1IS22_9FUNG|nr:hypothetical protein BDK51DRAFT_51978 [Blyttiomyces helicus]|eukprot:RKO92047.1 hypothetical protein BDK51DRAFT_51978 [Blyttiomyces helicus]
MEGAAGGEKSGDGVSCEVCALNAEDLQWAVGVKRGERGVSERPLAIEIELFDAGKGGEEFDDVPVTRYVWRGIRASDMHPAPRTRRLPVPSPNGGRDCLDVPEDIGVCQWTVSPELPLEQDQTLNSLLDRRPLLIIERIRLEQGYNEVPDNGDEMFASAEDRNNSLQTRYPAFAADVKRAEVREHCEGQAEGRCCSAEEEAADRRYTAVGLPQQCVARESCKCQAGKQTAAVADLEIGQQGLTRAGGRAGPRPASSAPNASRPRIRPRAAQAAAVIARPKKRRPQFLNSRACPLVVERHGAPSILAFSAVPSEKLETFQASARPLECQGRVLRESGEAEGGHRDVDDHPGRLAGTALAIRQRHEVVAFEGYRR